MQYNPDEHIRNLLIEIQDRKTTINENIYTLKNNSDFVNFNKYDFKSWCVSVSIDCLTKLRIIIEDNFKVIDTISLVATTRYIFELCIWLELFNLDPKYGLVYCAELIKSQRKYYNEIVAQYKNEENLFLTLENDEKKSLQDIMKLNDDGSFDTESFLVHRNKIINDFDMKASKEFSIFAEEAKRNGYGFQAHKIRNAIIGLEESISAIDKESLDFYNNITQDITDLIPYSWKWKKMASLVDMDKEYDYIYTYTSKILHATPSSITTNQKRLEKEEFVIFLNYINTKLSHILKITQEFK